MLPIVCKYEYNVLNLGKFSLGQILQSMLWKRLTTKMPQKQTYKTKHTGQGGGGSLTLYRRLSFHFHGTLCI